MTFIKKYFLLLLMALMLATSAEAIITSTVVRTVSAAGNGSNATFTISFPFQDNDQIYVIKETISSGSATVIPQGSGASSFTITGGNPGTAVVMGTAPTSSERIIISRSTPQTQVVDYDPASVFPADDHEVAMDKIVQMVQELSFTTNNQAGLSSFSTITVPINTLPSANAAGDLLANAGLNTPAWLPNSYAGNSSVLMVDSSSTFRLRYVNPFTSGMVSSGGANMRVESACFGTTNCETACTGTPCVIGSKSSDWISSVTRASGGVYTVNMASGYFSQVPVCTVTARTVGASAIFCFSGASPTTTAFFPTCFDHTGGAADVSVNVMCMGKK